MIEHILKKSNPEGERFHLNKILQDFDRIIEEIIVSSPSLSFGDSFETVSKNLESAPATFAYSMGRLSSITYTVAAGTIVKTFNYTGDKLTSIVLSGDTPAGVDLTKTFGYTVDTLTSVSYS